MIHLTVAGKSSDRPGRWWAVARNPGRGQQDREGERAEEGCRGGAQEMHPSHLREPPGSPREAGDENQAQKDEGEPCILHDPRKEGREASHDHCHGVEREPPHPNSLTPQEQGRFPSSPRWAPPKEVPSPRCVHETPTEAGAPHPSKAACSCCWGRLRL